MSRLRWWLYNHAPHFLSPHSLTMMASERATETWKYHRAIVKHMILMQQLMEKATAAFRRVWFGEDDERFEPR